MVNDDTFEFKWDDGPLRYDDKGFLTGCGVFIPHTFILDDERVFYKTLHSGKWDVTIHTGDDTYQCYEFSGVIYADGGKLRPETTVSCVYTGRSLDISFLQEYFILNTLGE